MSSRALIGYLLLIVLLAGGALAIWRMVYNSQGNIRRRERRARRARHDAALTEAGRAPGKGAGDTT